MTEELPETNKRELNNRRGHHASKITRASKKIAELMDLDIRELETPVVEAHQAALSLSWTEWETLHYHIQDTCDVDSPAREEALLEKVESQVEQLGAKLKLLQIRASVYSTLLNIQNALELLLAAEMDKHQTATMRLLQARFAAAQERGGKHLTLIPVLANMTASITKQLQQVEREISKSTTPETILRDAEPAAARSYGFDRKRDLLKVELPTFKGDIRDWPRFWKAFAKHIDCNSTLDEEDKLHYLRRYINSPNDRVIVEDSSDEPGQYRMYVELLKEKYDKPRVVHSCHLKELLDISPLKNDSGSEIARVQGAVANVIIKLQSTGQFTAEALATSYTETLLTAKVREEWHKESRAETQVPDIDALLKFLREMAYYKDSLNPERNKPPVKVKTERPDKPKYDSPYRKGRGKGSYQPQAAVRKEVYANNRAWPDCKLCKQESHAMYACPTFLGYDLKKRMEYVKKAKLCGNCLSGSHETTACRNTYPCRECGGKHNTTLHKEDTSTQEVYVVKAEGRRVTATISPTLELTIHSPLGRQANMTALFDTGASISLVTEDVVDQLGLQRHRSNIQVVGIEGDSSNLQTASTVSLTITSPHKEGSRLNTTAFVVPRIGSKQEGRFINGNWFILEGLPLANPNFYQPGKLELLLGNDVLGSIELTEVKKQGNLVARNTIFGWVLNGKASSTRPKYVTNNYVCATTGQNLTSELLAAQQQTNEFIQEFFRSENSPECTSQTADDLEALQHYKRTHSILPNGRFQVSLPRLKGPPVLGLSRAQAIRRYMTNEKSLQRKGGLQRFQTVMAEYLELGHAELVPQVDLLKPTSATYYLPMHAVYKESTTSPLRVVFDASAETSTGVSLNDTLLTGPTVYPPLTTILMRFRLHNVALTADISKMFRGITLNPADRDLHRFVWRRQPSDQLEDYHMNRVTFGVSCSPFLATQTLQQVAKNTSVTHPLASQALKTAFYVDDYISGTATRKQAVRLQQELQQVLETHGLTIRKWRSNSKVVLEEIPEELKEKEPDRKPYGPHDHLKTLGVHWNAEEDQFHISTSKLQLPYKVTKRTLASDVAQMFDVLGWFAPTTITMKLTIQDLWRSNHDWDDPADEAVQQQWLQWKAELPNLAAHPIPRHYFHRGIQPSEIQLHGFSDASLKGFAAAVYIRAVYPAAPPTVHLVMAKTKVAHVKGVTVPRLELCGARLLAEVITHVKDALAIPTTQLHCWCDGQVVLFWLDGKRRTNRAYVANRVAHTLELVPSDRWRHVPGIENPADCASRGISPQTLLDHPLWWQGPPWLHDEPFRCPPQPALAHLAEDTHIIKETVAVVDQKQPLWILARSSTYDKSRRILAWIRRFTSNLRVSKPGIKEFRGKELTTVEIQRAETQLYVQAQLRMVPANHPERWITDRSTKGLNPKADELGVYRVDGRLHNSPLEYAARHPVILKGSDPLTRQLIHHHHCLTLHGGPSQVMTSLSRQYYLVNGMAVVKAMCRSCVVCIRFHARREKQLMGQLPKYRVTPGHVFDVVGTDFAGPITINQGNPRNPRRIKAYICVFVCMSTKAILLEAVMGLSTEDFMACLRRFIARRGKPSKILSDNGTNFVGAAHKIDTMFELMRTEEFQGRITHFCTSDNIQWLFNPARAPHFGGIWEATVKSVKYHLRRIEYKRTFSYHEMSTVLCQIEAVLNSRPLMAIHSQSPEGLEVLTAGHFIIGRPLIALPEVRQPETANLAKKWDSCKQATQRFWREWSQDYLQIFHRRSKWQKPAKNVEVGDIVLLREETTYRTNEWPLAKVVKVYPGKDGLVRAVDVQHGTSTWRRPIAKLTVLIPVTMEPDGTDDELQAVLFSRGEDVQVQDRQLGRANPQVGDRGDKSCHPDGQV